MHYEFNLVSAHWERDRREPAMAARWAAAGPVRAGRPLRHHPAAAATQRHLRLATAITADIAHCTAHCHAARRAADECLRLVSRIALSRPQFTC